MFFVWGKRFGGAGAAKRHFGMFWQWCIVMGWRLVVGGDAINLFYPQWGHLSILLNDGQMLKSATFLFHIYKKRGILSYISVAMCYSVGTVFGASFYYERAGVLIV